MTRARVNCAERRWPSWLSITALVSTICVAGSARGETKVTWLGASVCPAASTISMGVPTFSVGTRSSGMSR
jgi:hypothetical protein